MQGHNDEQIFIEDGWAAGGGMRKAGLPASLTLSLKAAVNKQNDGRTLKIC